MITHPQGGVYNDLAGDQESESERGEEGCKGGAVCGVDDWAFHTDAGTVHQPASGTCGDLRGRCANGATFPAQPAIQQGSTATLLKESRFAIRSHARPWRTAPRQARFSQCWMAKCLLSRLRGLHANAGIPAKPEGT